jgi:hypothetical protein
VRRGVCVRLLSPGGCHVSSPPAQFNPEEMRRAPHGGERRGWSWSWRGGCVLVIRAQTNHLRPHLCLKGFANRFKSSLPSLVRQRRDSWWHRYAQAAYVTLQATS